MATMPDDTALMQEFEVFAARAGLDIPGERKATLFLGFKDLRKMLALLRQPRTAAAEPAGTYSIATITRSV
ncbi:hypothetical protein DWF00_23595 [Bosea caraganae]|uniref:Uncharacterized protein n=1 Tax=Bosea caraganae TaxID=2763117 RepID=A0A370L208_9HYPH|nr:hypothetical protein [Bosea caraganae]RDJ22173.1 hypothetical protein DWE98_19950 [Bosea caraganae]RDJ22740.1 hypothetical protein DWF00_23595 [Bosea caraganae]